MKVIGWIASLLLIIGGLNWGTIGLADINFVNLLTNAIGLGAFTNIVYILVGLAALWHLFALFTCKSCK